MKETTGHIKLDIQLSELKNCLTYMDSKNDEHLIPEFIAFNEKLDELRGESTSSVLPELEVLWEYSNTES